jgi:hypothetical protein
LTIAPRPLWSIAEISEWPEHLATPQVSIEFEVADRAALDAAAEELADAGHVSPGLARCLPDSLAAANHPHSTSRHHRDHRLMSADPIDAVFGWRVMAARPHRRQLADPDSAPPHARTGGRPL